MSLFVFVLLRKLDFASLVEQLFYFLHTRNVVLVYFNK